MCGTARALFLLRFNGLAALNLFVYLIVLSLSWIRFTIPVNLFFFLYSIIFGLFFILLGSWLPVAFCVNVCFFTDTHRNRSWYFQFFSRFDDMINYQLDSCAASIVQNFSNMSTLTCFFSLLILSFVRCCLAVIHLCPFPLFSLLPYKCFGYVDKTLK